MEAVKRGGDRQELHEHIRRISMEAVKARDEGREYDLIGKLAEDEALGMTRDELDGVLDPSLYIGRCSGQVTAFLEKVRPFIQVNTDIDYSIEV